MAAAMLVCGYVAVTATYERAIESSRVRAAAAYGEMLAATRAMAERPRLERVKRRVDRDIANLRIARDPNAAVADLLTALYGGAGRSDITVLSLDPVPAAPHPGNATVDAERVTVRVRGTFRNILRFLDTVTGGRTLISVDRLELQALPGVATPGSPSLEATVQMTEYTRATLMETGGSNAPT
jgi:hypothetical protein